MPWVCHGLWAGKRSPKRPGKMEDSLANLGFIWIMGSGSQNKIQTSFVCI